jgi:hypothetical protein
MRAAEFDERTNPSAVLYHAPRRTAAAEGSSIRPAPERLSRGERRTPPLTEPVPPAPKEEPIGAPGPGAVRMSALGIAARFIAVAGAGIGVAVIVAFSLQEPRREDRAPLAAAPPAKPVQTVTFKSQDRFGGDSAPATTGAPLREAAHEVYDEAQAAAAPLPPAIASWTALPPAQLPAGWSPDAPMPVEAAAPAVQTDGMEHHDAPPVQAAAMEHHEGPAAQADAVEHHDAPGRPPAHVRRHHRVAHAAQPPPQPADTREEKTEAPVKPVDNSLRSVLDKMFRPD